MKFLGDDHTMNVTRLRKWAALAAAVVMTGVPLLAAAQAAAPTAAPAASPAPTGEAAATPNTSGAAASSTTAAPAAAATTPPAAAATTPPAAAAPAAPAKFKLDSGDTAWMLTSTALVLMMTIPGLALFYGGMVRKKNVIATVAQSFAMTAVVTVVWYILTYSIAFGTLPDAGQNKWWGGLGNFMLKHVQMDGMDAKNPTVAYAIAGTNYTDPRVRLHDVPDDLRHHHSGSDRRGFRRAFKVLGPADPDGAVVDLRLCPDRPLGLGRRLPGRHGRDGLRRRHRGAHQRRHRGPGLRPGASQA